VLNRDILRKATRLTQSGQLTEATALLQRMLRNEGSPASAAPSNKRYLDTSPTIDLTAHEVKEDHRAARASAPTSASGRVRPLFDRAKDGTWLGIRGVKRAAASITDIVPEGTEFVEDVTSNEAGSRTYKIFVPSGYTQDQPLPLVVMLHGCTQSPNDFAAGTRMNFIAEEQTCLVVYPEQRNDANPSKCWNWFRGADQRRDEGEPSLIAGITRKVMQNYSVDPKRIYVAGLSAGGAAAAIMGATYPDLYAAVGIHSGLAHGAATDLPSALAAMRRGGSAHSPRVTGGQTVPAIIFHGDRDTTVHPDNAAQAAAQVIGARRVQQAVHRGQIPGGHGYTRTVYADGECEIVESWIVHGAGHAWSGGSSAGSFTDAEGPDAAKEMLRFFLEHSHPSGQSQ
jgi:poly(hydroxyalkanoate) depolymerase family esterase